MGAPKHKIKAHMDGPGFAAWLKRTREARGEYVRELAKRSGIGATRLTQLEQGHLPESYAPSVNLFVRLAAALEVELTYVLHKAGYPTGVAGVNMDRLHRIELLMEQLANVEPTIRSAIVEAHDALSARTPYYPEPILDKLRRALVELDLTTERIREGRKT
jgi:transcriptional regulator with XRE-family HTH domain